MHEMKKRKIAKMIRRLILTPVFILFGIVIVAIPTVPIVLMTKTVLVIIAGGSPSMWIFLSLMSLVICSFLSALIIAVLDVEFDSI